MKRFDVPLYGGQVIACRTVGEMNRQARRYGIELIDEPVRGVCTMVERKGYATYLLGHFDGQPSTLVHEASHLAQFVLRRAGIDVRESDGEALAYLLDWLCTRLGLDRKA